MTYAAGPPNGDVQRFDDDVATAVGAITDIEKLLEGDDGSLGSWQRAQYRQQLKGMRTRLRTMADKYAASAAEAGGSHGDADRCPCGRIRRRPT